MPGSDMVGYYDFVVCTTTSIVHPVKLLEAGHYLLVVSAVTFLQARTVFDAMFLATNNAGMNTHLGKQGAVW